MTNTESMASPNEGSSPVKPEPVDATADPAVSRDETTNTSDPVLPGENTERPKGRLLPRHQNHRTNSQRGGRRPYRHENNQYYHHQQQQKQQGDENREFSEEQQQQQTGRREQGRHYDQRRQQPRYGPNHSYGHRNARGRPSNGRRDNHAPSTFCFSHEDIVASKELQSKVFEKFGKRGLKLYLSYYKNQIQLARFRTTSEFLKRCDVLSIIPQSYRLSNRRIQNTQYVKRLLDHFSYKLFKSELKHSQKRTGQIEKLLEDRKETLKEVYDEETFNEVVSLITKIAEHCHSELLKNRSEEYQLLVEEFKIPAEKVAEVDSIVKQNDEARQQRLLAEADRRRQQPQDSTENRDSRYKRRGSFRRPRRIEDRRRKSISKDEQKL